MAWGRQSGEWRERIAEAWGAEERQSRREAGTGGGRARGARLEVQGRGAESSSFICAVRETAVNICCRRGRVRGSKRLTRRPTCALSVDAVAICSCATGARHRTTPRVQFLGWRTSRKGTGSAATASASTPTRVGVVRSPWPRSAGTIATIGTLPSTPIAAFDSNPRLFLERVPAGLLCFSRKS